MNNIDIDFNLILYYSTFRFDCCHYLLLTVQCRCVNCV